MINFKNILDANKKFLFIFNIVLFILIIYKMIENSKEYTRYTKSIYLKNNKKKVKYNRCDTLKLQNNIKSVFDENDIIKNNENWDLYMPCGYNYVEGELLGLDGINENKKIFAIDGCDKLASKNNLWIILESKYGRNGASNIMPETYIISNERDIELFKKKYKFGQLYFLKKNIQRKEGILLTSDLNKILRSRTYKVIQEYVPDLYILKNRKINLRIYLLMVCHKGNVSGYLYNNGKCIYTNKDFNNNEVESEDREKHLTSVNLDPEIYKSYPETLDDLEKYIGDEYKKLWNNILDIMSKTVNASVGHICKLDKLSKTVSFQLFGADIIFNSKMKPYLLELNKGPSMKAITDIDKKMKYELTNDIFTFMGIINKNGGKLHNSFIKLN